MSTEVIQLHVLQGSLRVIGQTLGYAMLLKVAKVV